MADEETNQLRTRIVGVFNLLKILDRWNHHQKNYGVYQQSSTSSRKTISAHGAVCQIQLRKPEDYGEFSHSALLKVDA